MRTRRSGYFVCFLAVALCLLAFCSFASASVITLHQNHSVVAQTAESPPAVVLELNNYIEVTMIEAANGIAGAQVSPSAYETGITSIENLAGRSDSGAPAKESAAQASTLGFV